MPYFNKEKDLMLIEMIKIRPCLHDIFDPEYWEPLAQSTAWFEIGEALRIPMLLIRNRWKYFYDLYVRGSNKGSILNENVRDKARNEKATREYLHLLSSFLPPRTRTIRHRNDSFSKIQNWLQMHIDKMQKSKGKLIKAYLKFKKDSIMDFDMFVSEIDSNNVRKRMNQDSEQIEATIDYADGEDKELFKIPKRKRMDNFELLNSKLEELKSESKKEVADPDLDVPEGIFPKRENTSNNTKIPDGVFVNVDSDKHKSEVNHSDVMDRFKDLNSCLEELEDNNKINPVNKFFTEVSYIIVLLPPEFQCMAIDKIYIEFTKLHNQFVTTYLTDPDNNPFK